MEISQILVLLHGSILFLLSECIIVGISVGLEKFRLKNGKKEASSLLTSLNIRLARWSAHPLK